MIDNSADSLNDTMKLDLVNQNTAAFMEIVDTEEDDNILKETGLISVRKATIRNAESILY